MFVSPIACWSIGSKHVDEGGLALERVQSYQGINNREGVSGTNFQRPVPIAYFRFRKIHDAPEVRLSAGTNEDSRIFTIVFKSL